MKDKPTFVLLLYSRVAKVNSQIPFVQSYLTALVVSGE